MKRSSNEGPATSVRAIVRVRPLAQQKDGNQCLFISKDDPGRVELVDLRMNPPTGTAYSFDAAYGDAATQSQVFHAEVMPHLDAIFKGINSTIFCYGMTGAGKTHTMVGTQSDPGLIPRSVEKIISMISHYKNEHRGAVVVAAISFFEIYNDKLFDLLDPRDKKCNVFSDSSNKIIVSGIDEKPIRTMEDFTATFGKATQYRSTAATNLNKDSSRSHAILIVKLTISHAPVGGVHKTTVGKLHLVDLAGSEDNRITGNAGQRLTESSAINTSLSALNNVVKALNRGEAHVPYRDSKLTRLLQDSLGGNSKSTIIANVAPGIKAFSNTQRTLEFAALSRVIVNTPSVNIAAPPPQAVAATAPLASMARGKATTNTSSAAAPTQAPSSIASGGFDEAALERKITEKMKKQGYDVLTKSVKEIIAAEMRKHLASTREPPKTPNTRTTEYHSLVTRAKAFEKEGLMLDALDELNKCLERMSRDTLFTQALPSSDNARMFKAVKTKIDTLTKRVNEATRPGAASAVAKTAGPKPASKNLLSSFNNANKENLTTSEVNRGLQQNLGALKKSGTAAAAASAGTRKRKRASDDDDDDSYDDTKEVEDKSTSEEIEEASKPVKPAAKRAKKVVSEEAELLEREKAKSRVREDLNVMGAEVLNEVARLVATLNTGSVKEITKLQHIGKKRAESIIAYRSQKPIQSIDQLLDVPGLSEKIIQTIIKANVIAFIFFDKQKEEAKQLEALELQQRSEYMMEVDPIMDS